MNEEHTEDKRNSTAIYPIDRGVALILASVVLAALIFLVLFPRSMDGGTLAIVRFLAAILAGLSGYLFLGTLGLEARVPFNKTQIKATGAFAGFAIVLLLFFYGIPEPSDSQQETNTETPPPSNQTLTPLEFDIRLLRTNCSKHIPDHDSPSTVITDIQNTLDACNELVDREGLTAETLINRSRALIFLWEHDNTTEYNIRGALNDFTMASELSPESPRASFYGLGYAHDFEQRILNNNDICVEALSRYGKSISQYRALYDDELKEYRRRYQETGERSAVSDRENLDNETAFILIELGHFLNNRDQELGIAIDLYDIVLAHYAGTRSPVEHSALVSRGVAAFYRGNYGIALDLFRAALDIMDTIELTGSLGSALARNSSYSEASQAYTKSAIGESDPNKRYFLLRDKGYALLLQGLTKDEPEGFLEQAGDNYRAALEALISAQELRTESNKDHQGKRI